MLWSLTGLVALAASITLLRLFRPRAGQVVKRPEWLDITVAIVITAGTGMGVMMFVAGLLPDTPFSAMSTSGKAK